MAFKPYCEECRSWHQPSEAHKVRSPCGEEAYFDHASGCGYRCSWCDAMLGSIGVPRQCQEIGRRTLSERKDVT